MVGPVVKVNQSHESVRYTEDGITVVALDRRGRGLHRARPELHTLPRPSRSPAQRSLLPAAVALLVAGLLVAWLAS